MPRKKSVPSAKTDTAKKLAALAAIANTGHATAEREHTSALAATRRELKGGITAGEALVEAKSLVKHGQWSPWLQRNCPTIPERTVRQYMYFARHKEKLLDQNGNIADLTMAEAVQIIRDADETYTPDHEDIERAGVVAQAAVSRIAERRQVRARRADDPRSRRSIPVEVTPVDPLPPLPRLEASPVDLDEIRKRNEVDAVDGALRELSYALLRDALPGFAARVAERNETAMVIERLARIEDACRTLRELLSEPAGEHGSDVRSATTWH